MHLQHQLPSKVYYLDRLGNMSTSSSCITNTSVGGGSTSSSLSAASSAGSGANGGSVRKQILPLKPKQPNSYVQHLEMKGKDTPSVPVTMLELKKKEKLDKNVVTTLIYRKPSTVSSGSGSEHHHHHLHQLPMMGASRRPGSPSSSGYETDSLVDQENCDVFSNILGNAFTYGHHLHHEMDMLHAHPIWSPQAVNNNLLTINNNVLSAVNHNHHHHVYAGGFSDDKFLVQ